MENSLSSELPELIDFAGLKKKKKVRFPKDDFFQNSLKEDFIERSLKDDFFQNSKDDLIQNSPKEDAVKTSKTIEASPSVEAEDLENDLSFDLMKKKKKKKVNIEEIAVTETDSSAKSASSTLCSSLDGEDADYTYEGLLERVFDMMREKDPNRDLENRKKLVMKPPQIIRIGTKKSSFVNFLEICKMLHRTPQHLQQFLLVELGTTGSVDGNYQLIIKGRFEQRQIENVLRRYIKEYVTCHTCKSPDTILQKDTRLFFLQCENCGSRISVTSVKSGFQALTGKRAAMRAKTS